MLRGARLLALVALLVVLLPHAEAGKKKKRGAHRRAAEAAVGADAEVGGGGGGAPSDYELDSQDFGDEDDADAAAKTHTAKPTSHKKVDVPAAGGVKQYVPPRTEAYVLEHSLGDGWSRRAAIDVSYVDGRVTADVSEQEPLDAAQLSLLSALAESGGMYRVRVRLASAGKGAPVTLASARASSILDTGLSDQITLHVGAALSQGAVSLLEYGPQGSSARSGAATSGDFSTSVSVAQATAAAGNVPSRIGPSPFAPKEEQQKDGKGAKKDAEQPGFLRRYWYIILPIVLMQLVAAPPPEGGAPGQGGARRRAAAPSG